MSSPTTSYDESRLRRPSNGVLQDTASRDDLPTFPFESLEDEDDSNGQLLQKGNLFQSLQHNLSQVSLKNGISKRAQSDSSKLNPTKKPIDSISSINSAVPSIHSNLSDSSQRNPFTENTLLPDSNRDGSVAKTMISTLKPKKLEDTHRDTTNDSAQLVTRSKSPVDLPTSSSKMTNGNGVLSLPQEKEMPESSSNSTSDSVEVVVYPKGQVSSTSVSHQGYDVPMIQPSVTQTSQSHDDSLTRNDNNLDTTRQNISKTNNGPDPTPIKQPPPLPSEKSLERDIAVVRELSAHGDFASDKPSSSPNVQSPPLNLTTTDSNSIPPKDKIPVNIQSLSLNSTTTDSNPISPKDNSPITIQSPPLNSMTTDSNPTSPKDRNPVRKAARRKPDINSFLLNMVAPQVIPEVPEKDQPPKTQRRPPLRSLQPISELGDSSSPSDIFTPAPDDALARKMEELGRLRRMESRNSMGQSTTSLETPSSRTTTTAKAELRPPLQTLQEDDSTDVSRLLREAYVERQQSLQTQLDKALAELRDVQAENKRLTSENKRLTSENQSQQRSISQLKVVLESKRDQEDSLTQMKNQLRDANSSLTLLNKEKKGWQDKLDSMRDKVSAAERQVRCLDHLTRHKFESRQEAGYGQPKRRGLLTSTPASTDIIGAMRAMNEEIYQTCVLLADSLEATAIFSTSQKPQVQKVLGDHLTSMMEDQAKKTTSGGYNTLLMQTVLEVFMTHWCSSIIEAFYPQQESFADLLVELSAQTKNTSGK